MLTGYNTNITFKGAVYHVQTEDSGPKNPVIITLLYQSGAILASKKTGYSHLLKDKDWPQKVASMMKGQHQSMIKELMSGRCTGDVEAPGDTPVEADSGKERTERNLDDILIDFIIGKERVS